MMNFYNLGVFYQDKDMYEESECYYLCAAAIEPTDWFTFNNLGIVCQEMNAYNESEEAYLAIKINSEYNIAFNNLGVLYMRTKRYKEAETAFKKAISLKHNILF